MYLLKPTYSAIKLIEISQMQKQGLTWINLSQYDIWILEMQPVLFVHV